MKLPSLEEEAFLGLMIELGVLGVPHPHSYPIYILTEQPPS